MKKSLLLIAGLLFLASCPLESQGLLSRVKNAVSKEITSITGGETGDNDQAPGPEPSCARDDAQLIVDLTKYKLDYKEVTVSTKDDGSILVKDRQKGNYYIIKEGISQGPFNENDARVKEFNSFNLGPTDMKGADEWVAKYPAFISRSGDKYLIKFKGEDYGPYADINDFAVSKSGDKFAAVVVENFFVTEDEGEKMEEAFENAKTDQERMDIAMKMSQQMQNNMMAGGEIDSFQPSLISNKQLVTSTPAVWTKGSLNGSIKFNDILIVDYDKVIDLDGKTVIKLNQSISNNEKLFVNSAGSGYAIYKFGALTFNDNTTLSELFNPALINTGGKAFLSYMYYSPGKNAIMQGSIPF